MALGYRRSWVIIFNKTRLLLSYCWAKASSHTEKAWSLVSTFAQDGFQIYINYKSRVLYNGFLHQCQWNKSNVCFSRCPNSVAHVLLSYLMTLSPRWVRLTNRYSRALHMHKWVLNMVHLKLWGMLQFVAVGTFGSSVFF